MEFLIGFFILTLVLVGGLILVNKNENDIIAKASAACSLFSFLLILSQKNLFGDTIGYVNFFNEVGNIKNIKFNVGFVLYTKLFSSLGVISLYLLSFPIFLFISLTYLYKTIVGRISYIVILLLILSPTFLAYSVTGFRQSLAMAAGFVSISLAIKNRNVFSVLFLLLSISFHNTAVFFIPILFILRFRLSAYTLMLIWSSSCLIGYFELFSRFQVLEFMKNYAHYFSSEYGVDYNKGLRVDFVIFSIIPILLIYYSKLYIHFDTKRRQLLMVYILLNSASNSLAFIPYSDRIYAYSWLLIPIIIASIYTYLPAFIRVGYYILSVILFAFYSLFWILG